LVISSYESDKEKEKKNKYCFREIGQFITGIVLELVVLFCVKKLNTPRSETNVVQNLITNILLRKKET